jgi:hypothetical protein
MSRWIGWYFVIVTEALTVVSRDTLFACESFYANFIRLISTCSGFWMSWDRARYCECVYYIATCNWLSVFVCWYGRASLKGKSASVKWALQGQWCTVDCRCCASQQAAFCDAGCADLLVVVTFSLWTDSIGCWSVSERVHCIGSRLLSLEAYVTGSFWHYTVAFCFIA